MFFLLVFLLMFLLFPIFAIFILNFGFNFYVLALFNFDDFLSLRNFLFDFFISFFVHLTSGCSGKFLPEAHRCHPF